MAVQSDSRGSGIGRALHDYVENWLAARGVRFLQVKTLSAGHPSQEYAETRGFYSAIGYVPLEIFPQLWSPRHPVLQLVKCIERVAA
jgi:GNAT superfamily N-acetyltransferase